METGKTGKYLKYAIGEIILVVIGILIALSINNWNSHRAYKQNENYLLNEILNNLKEDRVQILEIIQARQKAKTSTNAMLSYIKTDAFNVDSLSKDLAHFLTFERYYEVSNAYEMMKSTGLKISNSNLRTQISRYYDYEQNKIKSSIIDIEQNFETLMNNDNPIRNNLAHMDKDVVMRLIDPYDINFINTLYSKLIGFKDNNGGTLNKLIAFEAINKELINAISKELSNP
ncbi:hypothetical protein NA63_0240 [Flavobacteriaceae bacterium MAR_2010_105]|nr:hypothetical protein NA63_0240 [Flavobacteriaceae bacterium MAR_2010_105]